MMHISYMYLYGSIHKTDERWRYSLNAYDFFRDNITGLILGLRPTNERRCYFITTSLIVWAQA